MMTQSTMLFPVPYHIALPSEIIEILQNEIRLEVYPRRGGKPFFC